MTLEEIKEKLGDKCYQNIKDWENQTESYIWYDKTEKYVEIDFNENGKAEFIYTKEL